MAHDSRHVDRRKRPARPAGEHHAAVRGAPARPRHQGATTYSHVRVEIDLGHELVAPSALPFLGEIRSLLREREVETEEGLLELEAALLHALQSCGFTHVDHWEVEPGGWLPLPEEVHAGITEPVGHLVRALGSERWQELAEARAFSVRLSGDGERRADVVLRRRHKEREHTVTLDLRGHWPSLDVHRVAAAIRSHLTVFRTQITESVRR